MASAGSRCNTSMHYAFSALAGNSKGSLERIYGGDYTGDIGRPSSLSTYWCAIGVSSVGTIQCCEHGGSVAMCPLEKFEMQGCK